MYWWDTICIETSAGEIAVLWIVLCGLSSMLAVYDAAFVSSFCTYIYFWQWIVFVSSQLIVRFFLLLIKQPSLFVRTAWIVIWFAYIIYSVTSSSSSCKQKSYALFAIVLVTIFLLFHSFSSLTLLCFL